MAQIQAGQYLHTPGIQPLQVTEGKLHTKAPDLETLVSTLATDSRLELVRSLLAALEGKAATETTLAAAKAALDAISGKIATEASLAQAVQKLTALLERLDQKLTVEGEVQLKGSFATIKTAPTVGAKTVTTTAAELFAGASRKAGRYLMSAHNEGSLVVYWGPSGVTVNTGYPLLPGDSVVWQFDPSTATPIYAVASGSVSVRVVEI